MNTEEYKQYLIDTFQGVIASGGTEVIIQCRYCNDSGDHHHMYVSIPKTEDDISMFMCFKCQTCGMVTPSRLTEWGGFDINISNELSVHNKRILNNPLLARKYAENSIFKLDNNYIRQEEISYRKLDYINNRLGTSLNFQDMIDNKIVLNINDLLISNKRYIQGYTRSVNFINELNRSFLGFLSYDNAFINMRKINDQSFVEQRYVNYNIFDKKDNTMKFYILPTSIDVFDPRPIKVHIAEGPFDILSVKYNLRRDFDRNVYVSCTGTAYKAVLRCLIVELKLMNLEIHLYPDNDGNIAIDRLVRNIIQFLGTFNYPIYIHTNIIDKDMGVPLSRIKESIQLVR